MKWKRRRRYRQRVGKLSNAATVMRARTAAQAAQAATSDTTQSWNRAPLYDAQRAFVDAPTRFAVVEASTKVGKTFGLIEKIIESAIAEGAGHFWWVAPSQAQANIAFRRAELRLQGYVDRGKERVRVGERYPFIKSKSDKTLTVNGSTIWFKTASDPDNLYGEDVRGAVCDEITRWKQEAWTAVYSTLTATAGWATLIGNVKGKRNFAYRLARRAQAGEQGWSHYKLTAWDAVEGGVMKRDVVEAAERDLPDAVFRELYLAEATDDGSNPFGSDEEIDRLVKPVTGRLVVASGIDLARKTDYTVNIGLDKKGAVAEMDRFQLRWSQCSEDLLRSLERRATALGEVELMDDHVIVYHATAVDATGLGDVVVGNMQDGLVVDRGEDSERVLVAANLEGFIFTPAKKQLLYDNLISQIRAGQVTGYPQRVADEMKEFTYTHTSVGVRYSVPDDLHDDCVDALALAVWAATKMTRGRGWTDEKGDHLWS